MSEQVRCPSQDRNQRPEPEPGAPPPPSACIVDRAAAPPSLPLVGKIAKEVESPTTTDVEDGTVSARRGE